MWASTYDEHPNPLLALEWRLVSDALDKLSFETILDIGCGTGRCMSRLSQQSKSFGADSSAAMLAVACRKPTLSGKIVQADASALPFANAVADVTLCSFSMSYFPDLLSALTEIARVTKPSGVVLLSDFHPSALRRGWTRSFRVAGTVYEIDHGRYSDKQLQRALDAAGLAETTQINSRFSEQERALFVSAGKEHLFQQACSAPVVRIQICSKQ